MMDGALDWTAFPIVVEALGHDDPEQLLGDLLVLREHMKKEAKHG